MKEEEEEQVKMEACDFPIPLHAARSNPYFSVVAAPWLAHTRSHQ
jgi:hypothetical protein